MIPGHKVKKVGHNFNVSEMITNHYQKARSFKEIILCFLFRASPRGYGAQWGNSLGGHLQTNRDALELRCPAEPAFNFVSPNPDLSVSALKGLDAAWDRVRDTLKCIIWSI